MLSVYDVVTQLVTLTCVDDVVELTRYLLGSFILAFIDNKKETFMKKNKKATKTILVTGDVVIDHNIYQGSRSTPDALNQLGTMVIRREGGAKLLYEIICGDKAIDQEVEYKKQKKRETEIDKAVKEAEENGEKVDEAIKKAEKVIEKEVENVQIKAREEAKKEFSQPAEFGLDVDLDKLPLHLQSYAVWKPFQTEEDSRETVWKMIQPMGYGNNDGNSFQYKSRSFTKKHPKPGIIVLDDGALGFRFEVAKDAWPSAIRKKNIKDVDWVVLKMSNPVAEGDLWRILSGKFAGKLVVIISANDLRREEVKITNGLSWERTALDLVSELKFNARIRDLLKCKHLIINIGHEGALWVNRTGNNRFEYSLIFDPEKMETDRYDMIKGAALGYSSCLTASVVLQLRKGSEYIPDGIKSGLSAMQLLNQLGHGKVGTKEPDFPFRNIAKELLNTSHEFHVTTIPSPQGKHDAKVPYWTIMEGNHGVGPASPKPLFGLARYVAIFGQKALASIPYAKFGKFFTVDRSEIESLNGIKRLVNDYETKISQKKPLSIAVFGPPGSGKSFSIKQIAKTVLGDKVPILEFNLSQFSGTDDLICAFHQVRDKVLEGKTPFVFWDEFDSKELMWLQYLLAPMQDGKFREGQIDHPIGKCIFVFAGGTSYNMDNFAPPKNDTKKYNDFKLLKGPDFISRLSSYLNVLGPNRRQKYDKKKKDWVDDNSPADICFPVRRALQLRVVMEYFKDEILDIDQGLLTALLEVDTYKHGARSLETIVNLINRENTKVLRRSAMPPEEHMTIHVDYNTFLSLVNRDLPFKTFRDKLAPVIHNFYLQLSKEEGWKFKYNMEYAKLPNEIKADNLAAAERIPEILSLIGFILVPKDQPGPAIKPRILDGNMEILAEAEHNGWMNYKLINGWKQGPTRDDDNRIHDLLILYSDLSEENKKKDRNTVRNYPEIVKEAGYKIVQAK